MSKSENRVQIDGEHTSATVFTDEYDENCGEQIQGIVDHPAFRNDVAIMPDCHYGAGAVIGFTMPIGERVVPNTVGVDIGCGMYSANFGSYFENRVEVLGYDEIDARVRAAVPMGRSVHSDPDYHIVNDFPWDECQETLEQFQESYGFTTDQEYGKDYFMDLCARVGYDVNRAIASMGTLGGGNHFIEFGESGKTGDYWCTIHSGSRGIGLSIAQYWQEQANRERDAMQVRRNIEGWMDDYVKFDESDTNEEWRQWVFGGMGESFYDMEKIRDDFDGAEIEERRQALKNLIPDQDRQQELDWLEGEEAVGYFIDMIFAQKYASENRKEMMHAISGALDLKVRDAVESTHNYVDFEDGIIRKGATRAHAGERLVIPFNMSDGTILCEGKGNDVWNYSAPHGAGRRMSRTRAFNELSMDEYRDRMEGIFSTSVTEETLDEAPQAYKETAVVESVIDETAEVIDRWEPVHNIKAEE